MSIPSALDLIPNQDRPPNTEIPSALDLLGEERETSVLADRLNLIWQFFRTEWSQEARDEFARSAASSPSGVRALLRAGGRLLQLPRTLAPGMRTYIADDKPSLLEVPVKDLLAAVPEGIVGLASEPIAAFTGVRSEGGRLVPATEEERSAAILETAGNVVGLAAGVAAGQAVTKRAVSQVSKQLDATKTAFEAQKVVDKFKEGALSRAIKRGAAEGAVGGAAFGVVANPDDPDALIQALIGGVLFAPLGIAFERLRYLGKSTDEIGRRVGVQASILQQVRMLQATTDDSFYGISRKLVGLETADDIAEAVFIGKLDSEESFVVPGVSPERVAKFVDPELRYHIGEFTGGIADEGPRAYMGESDENFGSGIYFLYNPADAPLHVPSVIDAERTPNAAKVRHNIHAFQLGNRKLFSTDEPVSKELQTHLAERYKTRVSELEADIASIQANDPLASGVRRGLQIRLDYAKQQLDLVTKADKLSGIDWYRKMQYLEEDPATDRVNEFLKSKGFEGISAPTKRTVEDDFGLVVEGGEMMLFAGADVPKAKFSSVFTTANKDVPFGRALVTKQEVEVHARDDGLFDVAVIKEGGARAARTFRETGFLPGQIVSVDGNQYTLSSISDGGKIANLRRQNGTTRRVARERVRAEPNTRVDITPENLSGLIYQDFTEFLNRKQKPTISENSISTLAAELVTGEGTAGAGFDKTLITKLGKNLYAGDRAAIIARELLQNSIDAVRTKHQGKGGNIEAIVDFDDASNTRISIFDDGIGMTPEVALNQLLDIGSSYKVGDSAGGFGLAKVVLFAEALDMNITTVAQLPDGSFVHTSIKGSGEDWVNGRLKVESRPMSNVRTGTKVELVYPRDVIDEFQLRNALDDIGADSDIPDTVITGSRGLPYLSPKKNLIQESVLPDGSEVKISVSDDSDSGFVKYVVLNNGIKQFESVVYNQNGLPNTVYFDVKPKVATTADAYPFNTSRDSLKGEAKLLFEATQRELSTLAQSRQTQKLYEGIVDAPRMKASPRYRVIDPVKLDDPTFVGTIAQREYANAIAQVAEEVLDRLADAITDKKGQVPFNLAKLHDYTFGGLSIGKNHLGVNMDLSSIKKLVETDPNFGPARAQELGSSTFSIYLNPFVIYNEFKGSPDVLAAQTYGTLLHELAHNLARNHTEQFAGVLTRLQGPAAKVYPEIIPRLMEVWSKAAASQEFIDDLAHYGALKATDEKLFKGHVGHDEPTRLPGDADRSNVGPNSPGQLPEGTGTPSARQRPSDRGNVQEGTGSVARPEAAARITSLTDRRAFQDFLREFAELRGYKKGELPALENNIIKELIKEIGEDDPEVAQILSGKSLHEEFTEAGIKDQQELIRRAQTNNFFIEGEGAGRFTIRDNAGNRIGTFSTIEEALEFIDKSGQAAGPDANGGSILPPRFTVGLTPDEPPRPNEAPYIINRNNFGEAFNDMVNIKLDWVTQPLTMMKAIDKKFGTRFYELVGDPGMTAARRFSAAMREPMEKLEKILKPVVRLTRDRREVIGGYIEALNAVKNALPEEQAIAQQVLSKQIDFTNLMKYRKGVQKILKATQDQATIDAMARALRQQLNLSDEALKVSGLIDGTPKVRLGVVGQLVRNDGVQLKKYVSDHKMTLKEIVAAEQLNQFNKELGPESEILNAVMRHASLYLDGDIGAAARHFGLRPEQEAFLKRAFKETGELEAYEVDPFMSAVRFIRARASDTHLQKFVKEARAFIRNEVKKTGDLDESARGMLTNFLGDLQGHPTQSRKAMRALIADVNKRRGWNLDEDVIHKTVSLILQTGEAALQGARVLYAGVRDFMQPVILYDARFGARATSKMLDYGVNGYDKITAQMLEDSGEIARYDLITVAQADEYTRSVMGRGAIGAARTLQAANKAAFRLSGQSAAYRRIAAGIYLERWDTASEALLKYARGELTKDQAFKQLKMQTYDPPVIEAFERLVSAQKYEDATRFLARATVAENIGVFSQGNRIAWQRREFGRLAGQFGNWSQWFRAHLGQQLTRGTVGDRLAYITRLGASQAAFVAAGAALGINMRAWYLPPAVAFAGGPSVEMAQTLYDAMAGRGVEHELAVGKLKSLLPWQDGEPQIPNLWFPGKLFLTDVAEALELAESGDPRAPLRLAGYRPKD